MSFYRDRSTRTIAHAHVLLADDERAITDYLAPILERAGFGVTVARDGETVLPQIGKLHPHPVVLDHAWLMGDRFATSCRRAGRAAQHGLCGLSATG